MAEEVILDKTYKLRVLTDRVAYFIDELWPVSEALEAKKKLLECRMWAQKAIDENQ